MRVESLGRRSATGAAVVVALSLMSMAYLRAARAAGEDPLPLAQGAIEQGRPFAADISIRQRRALPTSGMFPIPPLAMSFHLERVPSSSGWRTTVTLTGIEGVEAPSATGGVMDNPFLITRVEYDDDNARPRLFNARGERVGAPAKADRDRLGMGQTPNPLAGWTPGGRPSEFISALAADVWPDDVAAPGIVEVRRQALEARFGPPVERRNDVNRFATTHGSESTEVLVDAALMLPVEITTTRDGALVSRTTMTHERDAAGKLVRRRIRLEQRLPGEADDVAALDVDVVRATPHVGGNR